MIVIQFVRSSCGFSLGSGCDAQVGCLSDDAEFSAIVDVGSRPLANARLFQLRFPSIA